MVKCHDEEKGVEVTWSGEAGITGWVLDGTSDGLVGLGYGEDL